MKRTTLSFVLLVFVLFTLSCIEKEPTPPLTKGDPTKDVAPTWVKKRLLNIAGCYERYTLVDYKMKMDLTPFVSDFNPTQLIVGRTPPGTFTSNVELSRRYQTNPTLQLSRSSDPATHGKKLYLVFATRREPGLALDVDEKSFPVGQVVVIETWHPKKIEATNKMKAISRTFHPLTPDDLPREASITPYLKDKGTVYHAADRSSLFIMFKVDPSTPDTDEGWVYGTVTANGAKVLSGGKLKSCMKCHRHAEHDRIFGPEYQKR